MLAGNIDEVIVGLDGLIAEFREQGSRLAYFATMYRAVTLRVREGIRSGRFEDGSRMNRFDTAFANRYFGAVETARQGRPPARSWRVAFQAESRPGVMILQHLLLGMNAHINFDLPITTVELAEGDEFSSLQADFLTINAIVAELLDPVQDVVSEFSPLLDILDRVGGRTDESVATFSVVHARDEAWHEATRLALEPGALRERSTLSLDRRVTLLGDRILLPGGPVGAAIDLIARTERNDVDAITERLLSLG